MPSRGLIALPVLLGAFLSGTAESPAPQLIAESYRGICDGSAGVALDATHFVVAYDDENPLHVFRIGEPDAIESATHLPPDLKGLKKEADLEGAAWIGDRIYWIGSHDHDKNGKLEPDRRQFFATVPTTDSSGVISVKQVGHSYTHLREDLIEAPALAKFKLADAAAKGMKPEDPGGFNIEGLAAAGETGGALIGFRNPVREGRALIVPLLNPKALVDGDNKKGSAKFGSPIEIDLGEGRGIRSIEYIPSRKEFLIVAGAIDDTPLFVFYRWSGKATDAPVLIPTPADWPSNLGPEGLFVLPPSSPPTATTPLELMVMSDDGDRKVPSEGQSVRCKDAPAKDRAFRAVRWTLP